MNTLQILARIKTVLDFHLITLGDARITLWTLIYFTILFLLLSYFTKKLRQLLLDRVLVHTALDPGARQAVGSITRYVVLFVGLLIILQTVGINLTTLNVLAGAVGIGVGFGLQNVASNFISGLIILFERPIKVGDRIEVGDVEGDVVEIGARSTTVVTPNSIAIIVPNSNFITEPVINWKYADSKVRFEIPIGVAYDVDVQLVKRLLLEVAAENPDVLKDPAPDVCFREFGDSSLNFLLRVWNRAHVHRKLNLYSDLNFAIHDKFKQHGVEIPFPQRVIHLSRDSGKIID
ncbi:MAG: mechanosensitive ion channel [Blastocatellia bacterium]|nr:mechanosensitive ion channel [Blastocatellia bacterium]